VTDTSEENSVDAEDLAQVADSLRRAVSGAGAAGDAGAVRRAVAEFGWHELLVEEPAAAVGTLFTLQGELLLPGSFLDDVLVAAAGFDVPADHRVLLPRPGSLEPTSTFDGVTVTVDGVVQDGEGDLLVACRQDAGKLVLLRCPEPARTETSAATLDPTSGWRLVRGQVRAGELLLEGEAAAETWQVLRAAGLRALAHELVAVGERMLRLALDHVTTREQFGRTLGSFQAVKHKLADVQLWSEAAALSAEAAWEDGGVESAALAKAAACRFSKQAREHCQQVLGGMGFTWEHPFHTYLRRALTVEPLLGAAVAQHQVLGRALREGTIPRGLGAL
jgi:hypothetical protein